MSTGLFGNLKRTDPHEAEAKAALKKLRASFDELFRLRALNEMAMRGQDKTCRYSAEEMRKRVAELRDPEMEARFKREMFGLLRTIYRRDPTQLEIQAGPPSGDGLGLLPALFGVAALVGGSAWGLSSITNYLSERERLARGEEVTPRANWGRRVERAIKGGVALTAVGGALYGAYRLYKWQKGRKVALAAPAPVPALPSSVEEVVEEEE